MELPSYLISDFESLSLGQKAAFNEMVSWSCNGDPSVMTPQSYTHILRMVRNMVDLPDPIIEDPFVTIEQNLLKEENT